MTCDCEFRRGKVSSYCNGIFDISQDILSWCLRKGILIVHAEMGSSYSRFKMDELHVA